MSRRCLCLATALAITIAGRPVRGEIKTVSLEATCAGGVTERATGFLVRERSSPSGILLVTALHAVYGCRSVRVRACGASGPPMATMTSGEVLVWSTLDIAAIRVGKQLADQVPGQLGELGLDRAVPSNGAALRIYGGSDNVVCGINGAQVIETRTVDENAGLIATRHDDSEADYQVRFERARGSLRDASIIRYEGPATNGLSGAALVGDPPNVVLGVHHAGFGSGGVAWAVALAGMRQMPVPARGRIGGTWPPGYRKPSLGQASRDDLTDEDLAGRFRRRTTDRLWALAAVAERDVSGDNPKPYGMLSLAGAFGFDLGAGARAVPSIGVGVGARYGMVPREISAPSDEVIEDGQGRGSLALLPFLQFALRYPKVERWRVYGGVALRAGAAITGDLDRHPEWDWVVAPEAFAIGETALGAASVSSIGLRVSYGAEWGPTARYRLSTVPGEEASYLGNAWKWLGGAGLVFSRAY